MKCPKCGNQCETTMKFCPFCGFHISKYIEDIAANEQRVTTNNIPINNNMPNMMPQNTSFTNAQSSFQGAVQYKNKDIAGQKIMIIAGAIVGIGVLGIIVAFFNSLDNSDDNNIVVASIASTTETQENVDGNDEEAENSSSEESSTNVSGRKFPEPLTAEEIETYMGLPEIPYYELITNVGEYIGKVVRTTVRVEHCYDVTDNESTESKGNSQLFTGNLKIGPLDYVGGSIYVDDVVEIEDGGYATVVVNVGKDDIGTEVFYNGRVLDISDLAKQRYEEDKQTYMQYFMDVAEEVSHDTLLRYPDTYKGKKIKIKVKIRTAEPDGIIFQGDLIGVIPGTDNEISFYDSRETREPRIKEGDVITVYGVGSGLATMKTIDKSGIIPKTIDKYDIPSVNIWFIK